MYNALAMFLALEKGSGDGGGVILFLVFAVIGIWVLYKWLSKKKFPAIEQRKWLKILISVVGGTVLGMFICAAAACVLAVRIATRQK